MTTEIAEWTLEEARELGRRIAAARVQRGWTLVHVATALNVTRATIGHWETGARAIKVGDLIRLCRLLEISADKLLFNREHWPFEMIEYSIVRELEPSELGLLQGALLLAAGQAGIDLRKSETMDGGAQRSIGRSSGAREQKIHGQ